MSLRYDEQRDKIIFDHLSPESPSMKDFREYYVPDMSYDAYSFVNNKWHLIEDIIAINKKGQETVELKAYDSESDTVVSIERKNEWENPEGENAPVSGGSHKAALPEDFSEDQKAKKAKKTKKKKKSKRRKKKIHKGVVITNMGGDD
jgi:hypothetical protein